MRPELARLHRIECHLLGHPQPAGAPDWQVQVLLDPELATDTHMQQLLYQGLQLAGRQQLRRELASIHHRYFGAGQSDWWHAAAHGLRAAWVRWRGL